jgi:hypothetical protein
VTKRQGKRIISAETTATSGPINTRERAVSQELFTVDFRTMMLKMPQYGFAYYGGMSA